VPDQTLGREGLPRAIYRCRNEASLVLSRRFGQPDRWVAARLLCPSLHLIWHLLNSRDRRRRLWTIDWRFRLRVCRTRIPALRFQQDDLATWRCDESKVNQLAESMPRWGWIWASAPEPTPMAEACCGHRTRYNRDLPSRTGTRFLPRTSWWNRL